MPEIALDLLFMQIKSLDHLVLAVQAMQRTCDFYQRVLAMEVMTFGGDFLRDGKAECYALQFGNQKINLHQQGQEFEPKATHPTPGSADLCFVTDVPLAQVIEHLQTCGVTIEAGTVPRTGAVGAIASLYIRDPDGNLLEILNYGVL